MTTKYVYPQGLAEQHPVQCRISIHKRLNKMQAVIDAGADVANDASVTKAIETLTQAGKQTVNRQIIDTNSTAIAQIYLYAPAGIQFSDSLAYDNAEMSAVVSALQSAADASNTGTENAVKTTTGAATGFIAGQIRKSGIGQQAQLQLGVVRNPRLEMLFRAPALRQLSLTWKFMPSNASESAVVEGLIKKIRMHAHPELSDAGFNFSFPDVFKVDFITKGGGQAKMIPFSHAYCTAVNVSYGGSGPAFFGDGSPAEIDFTMSLQETKVLSRGDIEHPNGKPASSPVEQNYGAMSPEDLAQGPR
jgi:hypothetical protein